MEKILVLNFGSTSSKLAVFEGETQIDEVSISHPSGELAEFASVLDQVQYRKEYVENWLKSEGYSIADFSGIACRGGLLDPLDSGTYSVNSTMLDDLRNPNRTPHASNLAALIGSELTKDSDTPCYVTDPVVVHEYIPQAELSGHPNFKRQSITHALNQKAVARKAAQSLGKAYEDLVLVVAHVGGGVSVACHYKGRMIDTNQALDGEGPFSPERSGTLPAGDLVRFCFSKTKTQGEILKMITGEGGVKAYLGTTDMREVEENMNNGDENSKLVFNAMAHQVAKEIGAMSAVAPQKPDAIVLTGGIAYSEAFVEYVQQRVSYMAPVMIFAGENEMEALALGTLRVLQGKEQPKTYKG